MKRIVDNARRWPTAFTNRGMKLVYGGTDTHFCMLDLTSVKRRAGDLPYAANTAVASWTWPALSPTRTRSPAIRETALAMGSAWARRG